MPVYINHKAIEKRVHDFVSDLTEISWEKIASTDRNKHVVRARAIYSFIMRLWGFSYPEIAEFIARDHTTIMHHIWLVKNKGWEPQIMPKILEIFPELSTGNPPNPQG